nr:AAA family ATPase [Candidatus Krumholzibacteria bacterium]
MRLTRLEVQRLPGIEQPFTLTAQPGMNVITGPNGVGKSSVTRAVFRLLWPEPSGALPFEVAATFVEENRTWVARSDHAGQVTWTVNDQVADPPHLPSAQVAASYRLGLLDLNLPDAGADDQALARQLRRQMDGGFDLAQVMQDLFPASPQLGRQELRVWRQAREKVRDLEHRYQVLASQERGLARLEQEVQQARLARQRAEVYEALLSQASLKNQLVQHRAQLASYPPGQNAVQPTDPRQLKDLMLQQQHTEQERDRLQALVLVQENELEAGAWPSGFDAVKVSEQLDQLIDEASTLDLDLKALERQLAGQKLELGGGSEEKPPLAAIDGQAYTELLEIHENLTLALAGQDAAEDVRRRLDSRGKRLPWWGLIMVTAGLAMGVAGPWAWPREEMAGWVISTLGIALAAFGGILLGRRMGLGEEAIGWDQERERRLEAVTLAQTRQQELGRRLGLDLKRPHLIFNLKLLELKLEAQTKARRLRQECTAASGQRDEVIARAGRLLHPLGGETPTALADLKAAARQLARRRDSHQQKTQALASTSSD